MELERGYDLFRRFCNPGLALRAELTGQPHRYSSVMDGDLVDREAGVVEDWITGWGTQPFGHRPPAVVAALQRYLDSDAPTYFTSGVSAPAGHLAAALAERTGYERAWFASGGTEAVEAALKLARAATGRPRVLYLSGAYHGCTFGSVSMMEAGDFRDAFGPGVTGFERLPWDDVDALEAALKTTDVAAVVVEPVQVEGGVRALSGAYLEALSQLPSAQGALVICDEIQAGLGRTGALLCSQTWPRRPDIVCLGKALGGGLMPLSAMLSSAEVWDRAYGDYRTAESHNSTFGGNALATVAGLAALELLDDATLARVRSRGARLQHALEDLRARYPQVVREVRGEGLLWGLELSSLDHPYVSFEYLGLDDPAERAAAALVLAHRLYRRGYITSVCGHDWSTLRLQPRLDIGDERVDAFVAALDEELAWLAALG